MGGICKIWKKYGRLSATHSYPDPEKNMASSESGTLLKYFLFRDTITYGLYLELVEVSKKYVKRANSSTSTLRKLDHSSNISAFNQ